ncbi:MAG: DUF2911 domain-containing protein [Cyclobacteriaceae bacterium]
MNTSNLLTIVLIAGLMACGPAERKNETVQQDAEHQESEHDHGEHQASETSAPSNTGSPRKASMSNVGPAHIHIDYSAPSVRGRVIWGGLVAYDQVWVTGAHKATNINFPSDVKIDNQIVPQGKYALFTIPGKDQWTIIINKNWDQHLADEYNETEDVLRFTVNPEELGEVQEQLTYEVKATEGNKGVISISWDKLKVSFEVEVV